MLNLQQKLVFNDTLKSHHLQYIKLVVKLEDFISINALNILIHKGKVIWCQLNQ